MLDGRKKEEAIEMKSFGDWPAPIQIVVAVVFLMVIRFLIIAVGLGLFYLMRSHIGSVPAGVLAAVVILLLITVSRTWQWQVEEDIGV